MVIPDSLLNIFVLLLIFTGFGVVTVLVIYLIIRKIGDGGGGNMIFSVLKKEPEETDDESPEKAS